MRIALIYLIGLLLAGLAVGCDEVPSAPKVQRSGPQRIVSLSPAITQMIIDLGKGELIVGVGQFDPLARQGVAVVGDGFNFDTEKLLGVEPSDVFVQATRQGIAPGLYDLGDEQGFSIHAYGLETTADILDVLMNNSGLAVASRIGAEEAGITLAARIEAHLAFIAAEVAAEPRRQTLVLVGLSPMTAAGPGTFLGEMLMLAGASNVIEQASTLYPVLDVERLLSLDPDIIVLIHTEAGDPPAQIPPMIADLSLRAVRQGRVVWLSDEQALLPSTSVVRITAKLAKLIHPELADRIDRAVADGHVE